MTLVLLVTVCIALNALALYLSLTAGKLHPRYERLRLCSHLVQLLATALLVAVLVLYLVGAASGPS